jgi:hypothetical protein
VLPNPPRATDDDEIAWGASAPPAEYDAEEALLPNPPRITVVRTDSTL